MAANEQSKGKAPNAIIMAGKSLSLSLSLSLFNGHFPSGVY